jgi:ribonuclease-3
LPEYKLLHEEGADHAKNFHVACRLTDDGTVVEESGRSRRKAEQAAAARMLEGLQVRQSP